MEVVKQKIKQFFQEYKKEISVKKLISILNLRDSEKELLVDILFDLEREGQVICLENGKYIHVPSDYYLQHGKIEVSSKNNYYIKLKKGLIIRIPNKNLNGAKENDIVFVETKKGKKHDKELIGNVARIVKKYNNDDNNMCVKGYIKKNYNDNYYYISIEDKIIFITEKDLNGAFPNDLVSIQITNDNKGKVIEVLKRHHNTHVLEYRNINGNLKWVSVINSKYSYEINLKDTFLQNDQILVTLNEENEVTFIKKVENENNLESYVKTLLYEMGFELDLSEKSKEEISKIRNDIKDSDLKDRVDLRQLNTITIDGDNAKDLDDAISLEYKDGKYYLYVHIADVSSFVKFESSLFRDAFQRGTSIYPANLVFHMLCEELSSGVCSLNEDEDKLTKTCLLEFDNEGNVLDYSIFNSVIRSNKKMSYSKVNEVLDGTVIESYMPYVELLNNMNNLSNLLYKKRLERGAICFQSDEFEFNIASSGNVESVKKRCYGPAHLMIENFMLVANQTIASIAKYYDVPFVYRNHESPNIIQVSKLKNNLKSFKSHIQTLRNAQNPKILQKILLTICKDKDKEENVYFSKLMLECMSRAYYDSYSIGHYALALDDYATFTSPIRRFPDLLNHYILDKIIKGDIEDLDSYQEKYKNMVVKCNENRLIAEQIEQNIDNMLLNNYLSKYKGETLYATIVFINDNVIGVKVEDFICGNIIVPQNSIVDNSFTHYGKVYQKGDIIEVEIVEIKEKNNEILFSIKTKEKIKNKIKKEGIK